MMKTPAGRDGELEHPDEAIVAKRQLRTYTCSDDGAHLLLPRLTGVVSIRDLKGESVTLGTTCTF
jgi:hypothetical protein